MSNVIQLPNRSSARALVAAEVRAEIARVGTSQLAVAKAAGIAHSTLNRKLLAKAERDVFDVDELERIADVLQVPITKFFRTTIGGPDNSGPSRLTESNRRPSHYKAGVVRAIPNLSPDNVSPIEPRRRRQTFEPARKTA